MPGPASCQPSQLAAPPSVRPPRTRVPRPLVKLDKDPRRDAEGGEVFLPRIRRYRERGAGDNKVPGGRRLQEIVVCGVNLGAWRQESCGCGGQSGAAGGRAGAVLQHCAASKAEVQQQQQQTQQRGEPEMTATPALSAHLHAQTLGPPTYPHTHTLKIGPRL